MNTLKITAATVADLAAIESIETSCFAEPNRASRSSLLHALHSASQSVWLAVSGEIAGALVLHHHPKALRIYSLAVLPAFQGNGIGGKLVRHTAALARKTGRTSVTLEADLSNMALINWYESFGFKISRMLPDYYSSGRHALHMRLKLPVEKP